MRLAWKALGLVVIPTYADKWRRHVERNDYNDTMTDPEIFEACTKLAEIAAGRLDFRRQLEWRISIAIWTALGAAIAWFRVSDLPAWIGATVLFAHGHWLQSLYVRHVSDTDILWHYFNEAQTLLGKEA